MSYRRRGPTWTPAESALCNVLALDPGHPEARNNLTVLRRRRQGTDCTVGAHPFPL
jgi:hypothetical protein